MLANVRIFLKIVLIIVLSFDVKAQETFSKETLYEDLDYLKEAIEKFDPALYHYNPEAAFNALFSSIKNSIDSPLNHLEFYKAVSLLCAAANEGHFVVGNENNQASGIFSGFYNDAFRIFPAKLFFTDNKAFVLKDFSAKNNLPIMAEVLSINNQSIPEIVEALLKYMPGDGRILSGKMNRLNKDFGALYFWFIDQPGYFNIKLKPQFDANPTAVKVPAISTNEIDKFAVKRYGHDVDYEQKINEVYELDFNDNYALLKLKSFNRELITGGKLEVRNFYKAIFKKILDKKVDNLVIDLRGNGGGSRNFAVEIVPYLMKGIKEGVLFTSEMFNQRFKKVKIPKPSHYRFKGNLFLMINGGTFSNGSVIAAYAKEFGDAIIIGEESGSRSEGFVAGSKKIITLPNTLIEVQIPIDWLQFNFTNMQTKQNRGVLPDYEVRYSPEEKIKKVDKEFDLVLKLIASNFPKMASPK